MKGLGALTGLYRGVVKAKNYLYEHDYLQAIEISVPVLSIGNLTMGGTGKTPLADFCIKYYLRKHLQVTVVSRNYRAEAKEISKVDTKRPNAAQYYGDEPVLLAIRNPMIDVFVGPEKFETAQVAVAKNPPQLVIIDDGFQHRKLHRDLDIVILDATEKRENYECIPTGRAREPFENLARADAIVVTKINLVSEAEVNHLVSQLETQFGKPVFCFAFDLVRLMQKSVAPYRDLSGCGGLRCQLISGIGQPQGFEDGIKKFGLVIDKHHRFEDHHVYTAENVATIISDLERAGITDAITTEKDFVKLRALWPQDAPLWVAPLEVRLLGREDSFYEILDQVFH
ncbi:MAG: tetraacyldisaccharide 4'-kinase [Bdellovibrionaceae bacterium]|nr:tetraacyldisaccharide 4'-kinase [Pseudobdellovibrionaceae bacterium]